MPESTDK